MKKYQHNGLAGLVIITFIGVSTPSYSSPIVITGTDTTHNLTADLDISGTTLTIHLQNLSSFSGAAVNPQDIIGSFYFDILHNGVRPTLGLTSAIGEFLYEAIPTSGTTNSLSGTNVDILTSSTTGKRLDK